MATAPTTLDLPIYIKVQGEYVEIGVAQIPISIGSAQQPGPAHRPRSTGSTPPPE